MNNASSPEDWHAMDLDEVFSRLESSKDGLSEDEARQRLERSGRNALEAEKGISPWRLLARQVHNPLIYLLMIAAVLSLFFNHTIDAAVIAGVIVLNSLLGFIQEWRAEGALEALREISAPHARILRSGNLTDNDADQVVPGDVLALETGDRVAADVRLLSGENLLVDESALTGESQPVEKKPGIVDQDAPMADRQNMLWMSTNVIGGRGRAVVAETGMKTQIGRIAGDVRDTGRESSPLQKRLHTLSVILGAVGITIAAGVFGLGVMRGHEMAEMLMFSVAIAVSAIPEGLPAVISVTLALGVKRMAQRNAIIRRLSAVETLGSTTVICSDKTGTITRNQMTVRMIWAGGRIFQASGEGYDPKGELQTKDGEKIAEPPESLRRLLRIGAISNNATLKREEEQWRMSGNPSEGALLAVAIKGGMEIDKLEKDRERIAEIPFSSDAKYMATLHKAESGKGTVAYVKGAPERIIEFCSRVLKDDKPVELDEELRNEIAEMNKEFASKALRVIAGAYRETSEELGKLERSDVEGDLILAGFWGMIDPPREEVIQAIRDAKGAGIHTVMITGDHAETALAIARQIGIIEDAEVLTGNEIDELEKPELADIAIKGGVFARVAPAHKLKIMEALKERGHIVAMTGDGVNDAPALKGADIGIAMGLSGTDVAREASDMTLTDDNFATIVHAVEEGRVIFSNLRRVVFFLLATNLGEILTLIAALVIGLDLPLTAVMILWINLVTDGACTVALGVEPRHEDVLKNPPRDPKEFIIDKGLILRMSLLSPVMAAGVIVLFWRAQQNGGLDYARTVAFAAMAAFQWFQAFNARSNYHSIFSIGVFSNRWALLGIGVAIALQLAAICSSTGRSLLGTTALSWTDWLSVILVSSSIWFADEIFKRLGIYGKPRKAAITAH